MNKFVHAFFVSDKIIKVHLPTKETWILVRSLLQEKLTSEVRFSYYY